MTARLRLLAWYGRLHHSRRTLGCSACHSQKAEELKTRMSRTPAEIRRARREHWREISEGRRFAPPGLLEQEEAELREERRISALYSIPSTWRRVEDYGRYYHMARRCRPLQAPPAWDWIRRGKRPQ